MDFLEALASMNKISLIAFIITLASIVYEIKQMRKGSRHVVHEKPIIPIFIAGQTPQANFTPIIVQDNLGKKNIKYHIFIFIILLLMCAFFAFVSLSSIKKTPEPESVEQNQVA